MHKIILLISLFFLTSNTQSQTIKDLSEEYNPNTTGMLEFLYGDDVLSQGGFTAVDRMFKGISLENKHLVDIGCGLGGIDRYLAAKHNASIVGLDPLEHFITKAQQTALAKQEKRVSFICTPTLPYPIADNSFDIAFSKEALLHCKEKEATFKEIFRILKPGGVLIILDWTFAHNATQETKDLFDVPAFHPITICTYKKLLSNAGFKKISTSTLNTQSCKYTMDCLRKLETEKESACRKFGEIEYKNAVESWQNQYSLFKERQILVTLLKTRKPSLKHKTRLHKKNAGSRAHLH